MKVMHSMLCQVHTQPAGTMLCQKGLQTLYEGGNTRECS